MPLPVRAHEHYNDIFKLGLTATTFEGMRRNRIILYPGFVNPPHRRNEALLRNVFDSSQVLNVIAAIIVPLDDEDLGAKYDQRQRSS